MANGNGHVTIAIAAVALKGKRNMRKAQWLKVYDREEDRFFAVRPFLLVTRSDQLAEAIKSKIEEMLDALKKDGVAYIGDLSFETSSY